jgi:hypothetical protein
MASEKEPQIGVLRLAEKEKVQGKAQFGGKLPQWWIRLRSACWHDPQSCGTAPTWAWQDNTGHIANSDVVSCNPRRLTFKDITELAAIRDRFRLHIDIFGGSDYSSSSLQILIAPTIATYAMFRLPAPRKADAEKAGEDGSAHQPPENAATGVPDARGRSL